jgi:hypothetical protein
VECPLLWRCRFVNILCGQMATDVSMVGHGPSP